MKAHGQRQKGQKAGGLVSRTFSDLLALQLFQNLIKENIIELK